MRRFLITVNSKSYEVEVEEVAAFAATPTVQQASVPAPQPAAPTPAAIPATGTKINAPMPGKILAVKAAVGQTVKRGDVLMILEAMKMENEIQAPADGTVTAIAVGEGATVNAGALLACIG